MGFSGLGVWGLVVVGSGLRGSGVQGFADVGVQGFGGWDSRVRRGHRGSVVLGFAVFQRRVAKVGEGMSEGSRGVVEVGEGVSRSSEEVAGVREVEGVSVTSGDVEAAVTAS